MLQVEPCGALELECVFVSSLVLWSGISIWNFISRKVRDFKEILSSLIVWGIFKIVVLRNILTGSTCLTSVKYLRSISRE